MSLVILHNLLNVSVQLANKRGSKQKNNDRACNRRDCIVFFLSNELAIVSTWQERELRKSRGEVIVKERN
jgi:hypothetical protein